jgi:membrane peptidoglycan carboxypeptidase
VKGYRIYTSIDLEKQKLLQASVDDTLKDFTEVNKEGVYQMQGAAVCIDNDTGRVVAIVGGRNQDLPGYTLNRAYQSYRQPGSSIKPLIVYTPSFERGYTPESIVTDEKIKDGPKNSDGSYQGAMKLQRAIELSKNTIAWKLFGELTPATGLSYLLNMNFTKISDKDYVPAAALGGLTVGVSPVEMAAGYAALEDDGYYREPTCIVKIMDSEGNEIVGDSIAPKQIYQTNAARIMTEALTGVIKNGTGKGLGLTNTISAGKTGTTDNKKDGWFVGYTPYYTTSVWVGYDMPRSVEDLKGSTYPGTIWHDFMEQIHTVDMNKSFAAI